MKYFMINGRKLICIQRRTQSLFFVVARYATGSGVSTAAWEFELDYFSVVARYAPGSGVSTAAWEFKLDHFSVVARYATGSSANTADWKLN